MSFPSIPPAAISSGGPSAAVLAAAPTLGIASVAGVAAPATPTASFAVPDITLPGGTTNPVAVVVTGQNIPPGTTVTVKVVALNGAASSGTATLTGTAANSSGTTSVTIPTTGPSVITATATFTLVAANGGPVLVDGEAVDHVRVTAALGGVSRVAYVTRSGREIAGSPGSSVRR
jgi:hypothetical protein